MKWILGYFGMQFLFVLILFIGSWFIWDRRFKKKHGQQVHEGFVRTHEVSIDPTTKKKLVVYFNSDTGERFYKEE
jgi:hypothetical protein